MLEHILLISDVHLQPETPRITTKFTQFIQELAPQAQALYILGDLFEMWIGNDDQNPFNQQIIDLLKKLSQTTPVYFIRGNRDFLIDEQFAQAANLTILPDPCLVHLFNHPVLLSHGDILCTDDQRHQRYRRVVMNRWVQRIFLTIPLFLRRKIAKKLRQQSKYYNRNAPPQITDVNQTSVDKALEQHACQLLIHGHTHRPACEKNRVVMGAWHDKADYVVYQKNGEIELKPFY